MFPRGLTARAAQWCESGVIAPLALRASPIFLAFRTRAIKLAKVDVLSTHRIALG
jgi:hypothetical protein